MGKRTASRREIDGSPNHKTERFEVDKLLRSKGFRIKLRRGKMPAVWVRHGVDFTQAEAELQVSEADLRVAERLEEDLLLFRIATAS